MTDNENIEATPEVIPPVEIGEVAATEPATGTPLPPAKEDGGEMVAYGSAVKAMDMPDGSVKLGGYLVRFSDAKTPDLQGQYFTKSTDFGDAANADCWFNHRLPISYGGKATAYKSKLGKATLKKDEVGIFAEILLGARNEYEKLIADLGKAGVLGWSSGTASHLIEEKSMSNGTTEITAWPLGLDASLTPIPAEPRNMVVSLKALPSVIIPAQSVETEEPVQVKSVEPIEIIKESKMEITKDELQKMIEDSSKASAEAAVKAIEAAAPAPDTAGHVEVILDEADRPFKSLAEQCRAVKSAAVTSNMTFDPRLKRLGVKATGASEAVPSDGGFLVDPTLTSEIIKPMHEVGPFSSKVRRLPVGANSNYGWINGADETSRATGSRWGGVQGYRLAEGATKTASKPKFRRINWELKKYAVLMYATDELLADSSQFNAVVQTAAGEELNFMANEDIYGGLGTGGPQGIMKSGSLISVTRDTASKILHADILAMWARLLPSSRANAEWFIGPDSESQLSQLYFASTVLSPYVSYSPEGVMRMMGRPVNVTEFNAALNTTGDILLADMSQYLFWEKEGVQAATSIHVAFTTDEQAFRWVYRCDGQTAYASAITPFNGSATQSAFVVLGSAT
jgi:HK97 family phage major capsid protein